MICSRCLRRSIRSAKSSFSSIRSYTTPSAPQPVDDVLEKSSTSLSSPISAPGTSISQALSKLKGGALPVSIAPAGTQLTGLSYVKGKADPVALEEKEYPEWLWHCLDAKTEDEAADNNVGDEFSKSKKQRRVAAKRQRKLEAKIRASGDSEALAPKVPLQQQTIDLPSNPNNSVEGALDAAEKRNELRKAMRGERRAKIKEANFLKGMK